MWGKPYVAGRMKLVFVVTKHDESCSKTRESNSGSERGGRGSTQLPFKTDALKITNHDTNIKANEHVTKSAFKLSSPGAILWYFMLIMKVRMRQNSRECLSQGKTFAFRIRRSSIPMADTVADVVLLSRSSPLKMSTSQPYRRPRPQ